MAYADWNGLQDNQKSGILSAFFVERTTVSAPKTRKIAYKPRIFFTSQPAHPPKTVSRTYDLRTQGRSYAPRRNLATAEGPTSTEFQQPVDWLRLLDMSEAWLEVLEEVDEHASLAAGWRGLGTAAVSEAVAIDATTLVHLFALELPEGPHPMIGADDEGSIGFTWHEGDLIGNLSVTGNGRFAYFVQRGERAVKHGSVAVKGSLPAELVGILRA